MKRRHTSNGEKGDIFLFLRALCGLFASFAVKSQGAQRFAQSTQRRGNKTAIFSPFYVYLVMRKLSNTLKVWMAKSGQYHITEPEEQEMKVSDCFFAGLR